LPRSTPFPYTTLFRSDNIVWGTSDDDNIVWGTSDDDNIVWGTSVGGTITWTNGSGNVVQGNWHGLVMSRTDEQIFAMMQQLAAGDRKSTRLNSSHVAI